MARQNRKDLRRILLDAIEIYLSGPFGTKSIIDSWKFSGSYGKDRATHAKIVLENNYLSPGTILVTARNLLAPRGRLSTCIAERINAWGEWYDAIHDRLRLGMPLIDAVIETIDVKLYNSTD